MAKKAKLAKGRPVIVQKNLLSDTSAGEAWLSGLGEPEFRDKILAHLFSRMRKAGAIENFQNIHGRNDKGVDYLVAERTTLQRRRIIGIQVKSKPITRTGDSASLSSLQVKAECEAALTHQFHFEKDLVRIDNIALWTSAHITEDAEKEFLAMGGVIKVNVLKPHEVFTMIDKYCPDYLAKIPQCALSQYVAGKANPIPKAFKLLGVPLSPQKHFLTPQLSKNEENSSSRLRTRDKRVSASKENIAITSLVTDKRHVLICGAELSGKSYLLEHLQALAAERSLLPFLLSPEQFSNSPKSIFHILAKILPAFTPDDLLSVFQTVRGIVFIDDIDKIEATQQDALFALNPEQTTVIAVSRKTLAIHGVTKYHIVGVDFSSIPRFLRALDIGDKNASFTDRAQSFISRSLLSSGLPGNPFTVAMLLAECQISPTKFSTPTMGRLIERFIEHQLGSHSEGQSLVDFETKREFLTRLAGGNSRPLDKGALRKVIIKHIHSRSLPHDADNFLEDLQNGGVFTSDETGDSLTWSHPVIRQFFWVKNILANERLSLVMKSLKEGANQTLAAILGSQIKNAGPIAKEMLKELSEIKPISPQDFLKAAIEATQGWLPTEEDEKKMLERIEQFETDPEAAKEAIETVKAGSSQYEIDDEDRIRIESRGGPIFRRILESKHHVAQNLAAVIVNARDTRKEDKENAVLEILRSNIRFGKEIEAFILLALQDRQRISQLAAWLRIYSTIVYTDTMLGDPFLLTVFKELTKRKLGDDERMLLSDLILGCGTQEQDALVKLLEKINRPEITSAIYYRIVSLYFYRYHRELDRRFLRKLLGELRKLHKHFVLPNIPPKA